MQVTSAEAILAGLACGQSGCSCANSVARGRGLTHCPSHQDHTPSLNVEEKNGKILVNCHSRSCTQTQVIRALRERNLWPEVPRAQVDYLPDLSLLESEPEPPQKRVFIEPGVRLTTEEAWLGWEQKTGVDRDFWESLGVTFNRKLQVLHFPFKGLDCSKYRPWPPRSGYAKYLWDRTSELRPPLWPLPEHEGIQTTALIVAGETDCAVYRKAGYRAYATSKGETSVITTYSFDGLRQTGVERVVFLFDLDDAGTLGAHKNAQSAYDAGLPCAVAILPASLANYGGKDACDLWKMLGRQSDKFRYHIDKAISEAIEWSPEVVPSRVQRLWLAQDERTQTRWDGRRTYQPWRPRTEPFANREELNGVIKHKQAS